ncbi:hypothetical protein [Larkinella soli]|uniref:hypothetical protein n=1 Tax=Larkinella soli TaxID=1770527 RepID=UPI000FFC36A3|nr:hypothetical protein [Larkinella soli]
MANQSKQEGQPVAETTTDVKYLPGNPKQYRFNGQVGQFFLGADKAIGTTFTFQPIAWRIFEENLFARGRKDEWAELFFVDEKNCVASIMFNNTSVGILMKLITELFYDDLTLMDVVLTVKPEKKENDKGKYFAASFEWKPADPARTEALQQLVDSVPIFREDTLTTTAVYRLFSPSFYFPDRYNPALGTGPGVAQLPEYTSQETAE